MVLSATLALHTLSFLTYYSAVTVYVHARPFALLCVLLCEFLLPLPCFSTFHTIRANHNHNVIFFTKVSDRGLGELGESERLGGSSVQCPVQASRPFCPAQA
eukprot:scaffold6243_cov89-Isochrysis_galbana.AAC.2